MANIDVRPCDNCSKYNDCSRSCEAWAQWFTLEWDRIRRMYGYLKK